MQSQGILSRYLKVLSFRPAFKRRFRAPTL